MALKERIVELDEDQARSDHGNTLESRPLQDEDQAGSNPEQSHVALAGPNPKPMYEDFIATVYPQVHESLKHPDEFSNDKPTKEEPDKANVETKGESMVTVLIIRRLPSSPLYPLRSDCSSFLHQFFYVENDLYSKIDKYINENVKEAVQDALQAPIRERFRELSEFEMKEILRDRMFESDSYRSLPEHTTLYEALKASMDRENREEFMDATAKSRKRRCDDLDPPPPPLKYSDQNDMHLSDSEDTGVNHLPKIKTRPDWLKPILKKKRTETYKTRWMEECHLLLTDKIDLTNPEGNRVMLDVSKPLPLGGPPGQVTIQTQYFFNKDLEYLVSGDKERRSALSISKLKAAYYQEFGLDELVPSLWIESERDYDISIAPRIAHWADNQDYKISEADFKNLHPNDFEDLYLLHLQCKLNHLSGSDKVTLFNAVNLWIRNIIIKHHMEDLQLGVEKLKAFSWSWDELVVSMQCPQGNPSLSLALQHSQPSMGSSGCVIAKLAKLIRLGLTVFPIEAEDVKLLIVIPEVGRIEDDILLIKDDTLREKLLNVNRLVAKIEALKDNPVPSSVVVTKSTSTFPNLFLEETNTFDNSLPESETFCFNLEEPSSGSPTTPSDLSLPDYEAFSNDHIEETSSGSTTTYSDSSFSKYDSFIFDLSINSYHPSNRSDFHEEFADELAQIISQPEYDCFFKDEPELGNFTMDVVGNIFQTREPRVHVLNVLPTLELDFIPSSESIFAYVVWIFLPFLFIPVIPLFFFLW
ncbi:hypothetical protein Tco_1446979 [Tanacetum coccineum]